MRNERVTLPQGQYRTGSQGSVSDWMGARDFGPYSVRGSSSRSFTMDTPVGSRGSTVSLQSMDAPSMRSAVSARTRLMSQSSVRSRSHEDWAPLTIPTAPSPLSSGRTAIIDGRIPHSQRTWSTFEGPSPTAPSRVSSATPGSWEGRLANLNRLNPDLDITGSSSLARTRSTDLGVPMARPPGDLPGL